MRVEDEIRIAEPRSLGQATNKRQVKERRDNLHWNATRQRNMHDRCWNCWYFEKCPMESCRTGRNPKVPSTHGCSERQQVRCADGRLHYVDTDTARELLELPVRSRII